MSALISSLSTFGGSLPGAVSVGLIWGVMAIGLYITYKILELSDLTVDGSFCTGAAVCALMIHAGFPAWMAMMAAFVAGMVTGSITGFLHTKCKIPAILAGILTQLSLWPINMTIMGCANILGRVGERFMDSQSTVSPRRYDLLISSLFMEEVKNGVKPFFYHPLFVTALITVAVIALLYWFFGTAKGASIRATGANEHMARAQGINTNANKFIGLMVANGLVALAGSMFMQYNSGVAEIKMGSGAIVNGLAAIIIGEVLFSKIFKNFALKLLSVSFGAVIYFTVIQAILDLAGIDSNYLKLCSAAVVAIFLTVPNLKVRKHKKHHKKGKVTNHA